MVSIPLDLALRWRRTFWMEPNRFSKTFAEIPIGFCVLCGNPESRLIILVARNSEELVGSVEHSRAARSLRIREFFLCIQGIRRVLQVLNMKQAPMALSVSSPQTLRNSSISWQLFLIFWIVCSSLPTLQIFFGFPSEIHILSGSPDITPIFVIFLDEENEQLKVHTCSATITTRVPIQRRLKDKTCEASKTDGTQTHSKCVEEAFSDPY